MHSILFFPLLVAASDPRVLAESAEMQEYVRGKCAEAKAQIGEDMKSLEGSVSVDDLTKEPETPEEVDWAATVAASELQLKEYNAGLEELVSGRRLNAAWGFWLLELIKWAEAMFGFGRGGVVGEGGFHRILSKDSVFISECKARINNSRFEILKKSKEALDEHCPSDTLLV